MFTDRGVVKSVSSVAKVVLGIFAVLCIGTERMTLFGYLNRSCGGRTLRFPSPHEKL